MKINKDAIIKGVSGATIMTAAFLMLVVASNFSTVADTAKVALDRGKEVSLQANIFGANDNQSPSGPPDQANQTQPSLFNSPQDGHDQDQNSAPSNIERGSFSLEQEGELKVSEDQTSQQEQGQEQNSQQEVKVFHHREIFSDRLINSQTTPTLKLEVKTDSGSAWQATPLTGFDPSKGVVYFLIKEEFAGQTLLVKPFTGNYQLIFN